MSISITDSCGSPLPEARRLDAEPGHCAAEGDGAQLRDDVRDQPVRQGRVDEVLVGAHALHVGGQRRRRRSRPRRRGPRRRGPGLGRRAAAGTGSTCAWPVAPGCRPGSRRTTTAAARPPPRAAAPPSPGPRRTSYSRSPPLGRYGRAQRQVVARRTRRRRSSPGEAARRSRRGRGSRRGRRRRSSSPSASSTAASSPFAPDETAIATQTWIADNDSDGSATDAAAYVRPSRSRTAAPSTAPVRTRVARARVTSLRSSARPGASGLSHGRQRSDGPSRSIPARSSPARSIPAV